MANIISSCRVICGILLLFFPAFSPCFYAFYIAGGITDMLDGLIARMMHKISAFGSKLDTAADIVFMASVLFKVISSVYIPLWLWTWIAFIALIKIINVISGVVFYRHLVVEHTIMNKVTGAILFVIHLLIGCLSVQSTAMVVIVVCIVATFSAIQEGHYIRIGKEVS